MNRFLGNIWWGAFAILLITVCCSNHVARPNIVGPTPEEGQPAIDVLRMIYSIAEEKGMRVVADLNMNGGELYKQYTPDEVAANYHLYVQQFYKRYGGYQSFWGWYINNELNPLKPDETEISGFWRTVWKSAVETCKEVAPESRVLISPFFIMDREKHRGFDFLDPIDYERWWANTLATTGIDILMLQDSGAEHLSFFTLEDRRPFFQAFKNACDQAGSEFWLNVESGQVDAHDWEEAVTAERTGTQHWVYTPTDWLAQKLELAAEYGTNIVNWGYYPYMVPAVSPGPYLSDELPVALRSESYQSYKAYYEQVKDQPVLSPLQTKPLMRGTLWWLPVTYEGWSEEALENVIRDQIDTQEALGFDILWIVNAPGNMEWVLNHEK